MFHGELTAALILYAYDKPDLNAVDHAVRMVLNYQASLEQPCTIRHLSKSSHRSWRNNRHRSWWPFWPETSPTSWWVQVRRIPSKK